MYFPIKRAFPRHRHISTLDFGTADTTDLQGVQFRHETAEEVIASDAENFFQWMKGNHKGELEHGDVFLNMNHPEIRTDFCSML